MSRLLQHDWTKVEQSLEANLAAVWQITQSSMSELGSRIDDVRETSKAATDSLERRIEQIAMQVEKQQAGARVWIDGNDGGRSAGPSVAVARGPWHSWRMASSAFERGEDSNGSATPGAVGRQLQ